MPRCRMRRASRTAARSNTSRQQIDQATGTLLVRGIMRNPDRTLVPGIFVKVRLPMGKVVQSALLVPDRALQEDQGGRYLLVVTQDDVIQQRYVQLGELIGSLRVITSGLKPDDRVVVGELWRATPGTKVTPQLTDNRRIGSAAMMSKFFIEHPVLANVLAIVLVLLGAVSLFRLPVSEYPNVVPPTVSVTASYPGASAQTVIDTIALPIEQQVNGVDRMLYMESTSAADGTYNLTVTFAIGTDPDIDQVLVQNRVQLAAGLVAGTGAGTGGQRPEEEHCHPADRHAEFAGRQVRRPVHEQLRDHQPDQCAGAAAWCRQRQGVRRGHVFHADLDGSAEAPFVRSGAEGRDRRHPPAEPERRGRTGRHAAGAERTRNSSTPWISSHG